LKNCFGSSDVRMRCGWQGVLAGVRKRGRIGGFGEAFVRRPGLPDARSAPDEFFNGGLLDPARIPQRVIELRALLEQIESRLSAPRLPPR
jgi:hypothetical protein